MEKENLNSPNGWLIDPHNKWAIHFDSKNESKEQSYILENIFLTKN